MTDLSVLADDSAAIRFVVECIARTPDLYVRAIEGSNQRRAVGPNPGRGIEGHRLGC